MFRWRLGVGDCPNTQESEEQSPVFVQWLDSIWQLWKQMPWAFEFSEQLLSTIYTHVYSGLFGTFQYNCEQEKRMKEAEAPTRSLWWYLMHRKEQFYNPSYNERKSMSLKGMMLDMRTAETNLQLWDAHIACADPICRKYTA
jgi:hypothetical protein